uniref:Ovule protein n=1 Tax=Panagrolaimus sp. PS1159 TaxID=55785 RepID=A0AC35F8U8_9BILA
MKNCQYFIFSSFFYIFQQRAKSILFSPEKNHAKAIWFLFLLQFLNIFLTPKKLTIVYNLFVFFICFIFYVSGISF